jgi:hypothetical protein
MIRILLLALLFVGLFRFITRFLFPIFRITSAVRGQMRNMQNMQGQQNVQHEPAPPRPKAAKSDYIDFEEVK